MLDLAFWDYFVL